MKGLSFWPLDKEDQKSQKSQLDIVNATKQAEESLLACLQSDSFLEYRKDLEKAYKDLIQAGITVHKTIKDKDNRLAIYDALFVRADVLSQLNNKLRKDYDKVSAVMRGSRNE